MTPKNMSQSIEVISGKITESYKSTIKNQEAIDSLLDQINQKKKSYREIIYNVNAINKLLCDLTWVDKVTESDKALLKGLITMGEHTDKMLRVFCADQKRKYQKNNLFKEELNALLEAIDLHHEIIHDVNNIFFNLRDNEELKKAYDLLQ